MPKFDLNKTQDFARLTLSTASGALLQLAGLSGNNWDIQEAAYGHPQNKGEEAKIANALSRIISSGLGFSQKDVPVGFVLFHVFKSSVDYDAGLSKVVDNSGRRKAILEFPYKDGQFTDDIGRKGDSFEFDVLIHGPNYKTAYKNLIAQFNDPRPGTLIHPVRGRIRAAVQDWQITHENSARNAVAMHIRFIEHTFDAQFEDKDADSTKSLIAKALSFLGTIDSILTTIESVQTVARSFKSFATASVQAYRDLYVTNLQGINRTFNNGSSSDLPGLNPNNQNPGSFPIQDTLDASLQTAQAQVDSNTIVALAAQQSVDQMTLLREQLNETIDLLDSANDGEGSLIFFDEIKQLKESAISIQNSLEQGLRSSNSRIKSYTTPRLMTFREICFANGISVDRAYELELLNPDVLSTQYIEKSSVIKVPTA